MAKRGMNIYKRKDGRWEGRYKIGYTSDGKAKYRSVYRKSYSAVKAALEKYKSELNSSFNRCTCTVGELVKLWLSDACAKIKESTYANYVMKLEKHILPYFAGMKYEMLTAEKINEFIRIKRDSGLSAKYISDIVIILKTAAKFGSRNYGYANRIEYVSLPKVCRNINKPMLNGAEQKRLRNSLISSNTLSDMGILLASVTGIRIGELCALKWSDIDFEKSILTVSKTVQRIKNINSDIATKVIISAPKSVKSNREIPLPEFIVPVLKANKSANENYILSNSKKIIEPRTMQYRFKSLLKKLKLPSVNFHGLRHPYVKYTTKIFLKKSKIFLSSLKW